MENLEPYASQFNLEYPKYSDKRYKEICDLVSIYSLPLSKEFLNSEKFKEAQKLLFPLISIKNYKSQIPFPEDIISTINIIVGLVKIKKVDRYLKGETKSYLEQLLNIKGLQLPTVSAIFHFCHPTIFPIIDRNVVAACKLLKERYPDEFIEQDLPKLPIPSPEINNKVEKYLCFIKFIDRIVELQKQYTPISVNLRFIDKALMVYGVEKFRVKVEKCQQSGSKNSTMS